MEIWSGHSETSVISQVSAVEGCPLNGVPLYSNVLCKCAVFMQSCRCDGILEVWDISEALLVSKLNLNLNTKVYYCNFLLLLVRAMKIGIA